MFLGCYDESFWQTRMIADADRRPVQSKDFFRIVLGLRKNRELKPTTMEKDALECDYSVF